MINNLRAKPVKVKEINNDIFELIKNRPRQINKNNNSHIAHLYEDKEDEHLYLHSKFNDEACAMLCHEFYLNFVEQPKKVDLSYYYFSEKNFSEKNKVSVYLYDLKKTFSGIDVMIDLIEQWKSSLIDAKYCIDKLDEYEIQDIHVGVITENNKIECRKQDLDLILHPDSLECNRNVSSSVQSKRNASTSDIIAKAKILKGFDEGKVELCGVTYQYDIRLFHEKKHDMSFVDGILEK